MKKLLLLIIVFSGNIFSALSQSPDKLNSYRAVFVPQLYYGKEKTDIYDIRKTLIEKLDSSGIPVFLDEHSITSDIMRDPCSMLHCLANNIASPNGKNKSLVYILFADCKNDTVLICSADADLVPAFAGTKNNYIKATKKALSVFDNYHYKFSASDSSSQTKKENDGSDSIQWNPGIKLTWNDFKGEAHDDDPADALTYSSNQTTFQSFGLGNRIEVEGFVTCYFIKTKSWVKHAKESDYLLNHEQRHFDLAEVGARELRKKFKQSHFTNENFKKETSLLINETDEKYKKLQVQYDTETNHSRIEDKQEEWNKKIDRWMKELEDYK